jgi:hypothetical protein
MKKTMTKSTMLAASIMALAAFAMPSMASAANWGPVNTNHTLTGTFIPTWAEGGGPPNTNFVCTASLGVHTRLPASSTLDITSATFPSCQGDWGQGSTCKVTAIASGLPWTATGTSTSDVRINVTDITATYSNFPNSTSCAVVGRVRHFSGTVTGGAWSAAAHSLTYSLDPGLIVGFGFGYTGPAQTSGVLTDSGPVFLTLT